MRPFLFFHGILSPPPPRTLLLTPTVSAGGFRSWIPAYTAGLPLRTSLDSPFASLYDFWRTVPPPARRIAIVGARRAFRSRAGNSMRLLYDGCPTDRRRPVDAAPPQTQHPPSLTHNCRRCKRGILVTGPVRACPFHIADAPFFLGAPSLQQ